MSFWNLTNPAKPKGIKDPNAILDYPISFVDWLAQEGATYSEHTVLTSGGLVCDSSSEVDGVIIPILSGGDLGTTATFTIRISALNAAGTTVVDDRTFYLKIQER